MSTPHVNSLEAVTISLRNKFRIGYTIVVLSNTFSAPLLASYFNLPIWYLIAMPLTIGGLMNLGYFVFGDTGSGLGVMIASGVMAFLGAFYTNGFINSQPVALYIICTFVGLLSSSYLSAISGLLSLILLSGLYLSKYYFGVVYPVAFDFAVWRSMSIFYVFFMQMCMATVVPLFEQLADAPVHGLDAIGEQLRITEATREATAQARDALAAYSHEMRTPLNVIHAMAQALLRSGEPLSDHHSTLIRLLHSSAQNLLVISNNVLDVSAIWANALTIHEGKFPIENVLDEWVVVARETAERRNVEVTYLFSNTTGGVTHANFDEGRVKQIMHNVFDHALRVTKQSGSIKVLAQVTKHATDQAKCLLHVSFVEQEARIPAHELATIFALPYITAMREATIAPSAALGMYIARKLSRALGGQLTCTSDNSGVTYAFTVPLTIASSSESAMRPLRILYAEDEPANQFVMRTLLKDSGHKLEMVNDGSEAVQMYETEKGNYDVILLDMHMPILGGVETAAAIRAREKSHGWSRTVIAFISAGPVSPQELTDSGADHVLQKPNSKPQLTTYFASVSRSASPVTSPGGPEARSFEVDLEAVKYIEQPADLPVYVKRALRVFFFPRSVPLLWMGKYHAALLCAFAAIVACLYQMMFTDPQDRLPLLICMLSFCVAPFLVRSENARLYVSLYSPLQSFIFLIWVSVRGAGFDSFYLHSTYILAVVLVVGTDRLTIAVTAMVHVLLGAVFLAAVTYNWMTFPVTFTEETLAIRLLFFWCLSIAFNTLYSVWTDRTRVKAYNTLMERNEELVGAQRKTQRKQRAMLELSTNVSYDIRTPLNVVLGITDRLKEAEDLPEAMRQSAGVLDTAGGMLLLLLDNVVDARRVDAGDSIPFTLGKVNLRNLGRRISTMMAFYARGKRLKLLLRIGETVPVSVISDELRLQQVLVNLLTNAIKFTQRGTITVSIENAANPEDNIEVLDATTSTKSQLAFSSLSETTSRSSSHSSGDISPDARSTNTSPSEQAEIEKMMAQLRLMKEDRVPIRFSVSDSGPGIEKDALARLFHQYEAGVSTATRKARGAGLGLFISRAIVEKAGGELNVTSTVDVGTRFYFTLPLCCSADGDSLENDTQADIMWSRPLRILAVEDAPEMQYIFRLFLSDTPHITEMAGTAAEALKLFREQTFDVVLLDQHLPDMTGPEVAKKIRVLPGGKRAILAAVTGDATDAAKEAAIGAGCDYFLSKPLARDSLMNLLGMSIEMLLVKDVEIFKRDSPHVRGSPMNRISPATDNHTKVPQSVLTYRGSKASSSPTKSPLKPVARVSPDGERELVEVPQDLYEYLMQEWLPRLNDELKQMKMLLTVGDLKATKEMAHRIKGSAHTFGLVRIGELCEQLASATAVEANKLVAECLSVMSKSDFIKVKVDL